jgi:transcriptional regulator with XRE-family HTH domain
MDSFGEYLRRLRKTKGLTLKQVEEKGVASNAYLSQLERGLRKRPHPDILKKMAEVYGVQITLLLTAAGYLPPEVQKEPSAKEIERAYDHVESDPRFSHGTRRKNEKLSLAAKRRIVEIYVTLTGQNLL